MIASPSSELANQRSEIFALYQARLHAEEIEFAAREEHDATLQRMVNNQYTRLNNDYESEKTRIDRDAKISFSVTKNHQRIEILNKQRNFISSSIEVVKKRLADFKGTPDYQVVLKKLISQAIKTISEPNINLYCVKSDAANVKKIIEELKSTTKSELTLSEEYLEDKKIGGIYVTNDSDTIRVDNTFEARLNLAAEGALPKITSILSQ